MRDSDANNLTVEWQTHTHARDCTIVLMTVTDEAVFNDKQMRILRKNIMANKIPVVKLLPLDMNVFNELRAAPFHCAPRGSGERWRVGL